MCHLGRKCWFTLWRGTFLSGMQCDVPGDQAPDLLHLQLPREVDREFCYILRHSGMVFSVSGASGGGRGQADSPERRRLFPRS